MDARRAAEEQAVARHRVVDARPGERHRADARRNADDRDDAHDVAGANAEQPVGDDVEHAALHLRELVDRQHVEKQQVQQEIDRDTASVPSASASGTLRPGLVNLFGDIRRRRSTRSR